MQFTAAQIAALVNGTVEGNADVVVNTIAKIEEGCEGAISFLANPKYTHFIYSTASSVVLVKDDFKPESEVKATLIRVADPYATVASLLDMVSKMMDSHPVGIEQPSHISDGVNVDSESYIGAFSYIGDRVRLGKNVKIYPQCYIGHDVVIGDNTVIYPGVKIYHNCKVGTNCVIHAGVVIGADGFGFAPVNGSYNKIPQIGNVVIEDDVEIGANTCVDRATMGSTVISKGVKLDNLIQIAHNCRVGENTVMASQVGVAGSTRIGHNCMVGGQVGFSGHISVGDYVQIGAQSGIPRDIPSGKKMMGYPATEVSKFARQSSAVANLPELFKRVQRLEREINNSIEKK